MTFGDMVEILHAKVLCGEDMLDHTAKTVCCSDLMSDVLAFVNEKSVLITGLVNPHVIRTADMLDLKCLVFARGKIPPEEILEAAREQGMVVMATKETAFTTSGLLYEAGLRGAPILWPEAEEQTQSVCDAGCVNKSAAPRTGASRDAAQTMRGDE